MKKLMIYGFRFVTTFIMKLPFNFFRVLYLRMFMKIGKHVYIGRNVDIRYPFNIEIGDFSIINKNCVLDGRGAKLVIGRNVDIAQETNIWTLEHDVNDKDHSGKAAAVVINDHVWIASRTTILPGVNLAEGVVVACGAVVTKSFGPMEIVGGVPARKIAMRNNPCTYELNYPL